MRFQLLVKVADYDVTHTPGCLPITKLYCNLAVTGVSSATWQESSQKEDFREEGRTEPNL
jgi:hypothetical protein